MVNPTEGEQPRPKEHEVRPGKPGSPEETQGMSEAFPMSERDLVEHIRSAETVNQLRGSVMHLMAYKEGLKFGIERYDLDSPTVLLDLKTKFTSKERMMDRPSVPYYAEAALNERVSGVARRLKRKEELTQNEQKIIEQLIQLGNLTDARKVVDQAFLQRMRVCENATGAAQLGFGESKEGKVFTPDQVHFQSIFRDKDGQKINNVIREIIRMGTPPEELRKVNLEPVEGVPYDVYAQGFVGEWVDGEYRTGQEIFQKWIKHLNETAEGRMDLVWLGFRIAVFWEEISELGLTINEDLSKKKDDPGRRNYIFGDPPIVNNLWPWIKWTKEKRWTEFGLDADKRRVRPARFITHSGHPGSNINMITDLCSSYLKYAKVKRPKSPGDIKKESLWKIWWEEGVSFADEAFPWERTEVQPEADDIDSVPPGMISGWFLSRARAKLISDYARSTPKKEELIDPHFYEGMLRNWEKIQKVKPDTPSKENPRAVWLLDVLASRLDPPTTRDNPYYSYTSPRETMSGERVDLSASQMGELRTPSIYEALEAAREVGFISGNDYRMIIDSFSGLKKRKSPIKRKYHS